MFESVNSMNSANFLKKYQIITRTLKYIYISVPGKFKIRLVPFTLSRRWVWGEEAISLNFGDIAMSPIDRNRILLTMGLLLDHQERGLNLNTAGAVI